MPKKCKTQAERMAEILELYARAETPKERNRLAKLWLDAGGREVMDNAASAGLKSLKRPLPDGDS